MRCLAWQVTDDVADYIRHAMHMYINRILDICKLNAGESEEEEEEEEGRVLTMEDVQNASVDLQRLLFPNRPTHHPITPMRPSHVAGFCRPGTYASSEKCALCKGAHDAS
jgi:hypothetical protein